MVIKIHRKWLNIYLNIYISNTVLHSRNALVGNLQKSKNNLYDNKLQ